MLIVLLESQKSMITSPKTASIIAGISYDSCNKLGKTSACVLVSTFRLIFTALSPVDASLVLKLGCRSAAGLSALYIKYDYPSGISHAGSQYVL